MKMVLTNGHGWCLRAKLLHEIDILIRLVLDCFIGHDHDDKYDEDDDGHHHHHNNYDHEEDEILMMTTIMTMTTMKIMMFTQKGV